jgi:hypothetical protein
MFEKREYRMYQGVKREDIYYQICDFWAKQGFYVWQISPYQIQGRSYLSKIGLRRDFFLRLDEHDNTTYLDLSMQANITDEGFIGGAAAAVLFWPAAIVGGAISYDQYENDARALMGSFWAYVDTMAQTNGIFANAPQPQAPQPQVAPTVYCQGCGAIIPQDWKACPYCGRVFGE